MQRLALVTLALLLACGCAASMPPLKRATPFLPGEFAPYGRTGTASLRGQAFAKTAGGDVKYAAGDIVTLCPATEYTEEWFSKDFCDGLTMEPLDSLSLAFFRNTVADGEGHFRFDHLPSGRYLVACRLAWAWGSRSDERSEVALGYRGVLQDGDDLNVVLLPVTRRSSPSERMKPVQAASRSESAPEAPETLRARARALVATGVIDTFAVYDGEGTIIVGPAFAKLSPDDQGSAIRVVAASMHGSSGPMVVGEAGTRAILGSWIPGRGYRPSNQPRFFGSPSAGHSP